jgi:GH15 family glucan-1,4-alpha-glucosidase
MPKNDYPSINDYGFIADCHSAALISRSGSIDWCCMPRIDSRSCFGRLLDWHQGGYCRIAPGDPFEVERHYLEGTLVLQTLFKTQSGQMRLTDCFTMRPEGEHHPHRQILRVMEGIYGSVRCEIEIVPRFDYGAIKPWIRHYSDGHHIALGGSDGLLVSSDLSIHMVHRHDLSLKFTLKAGERRYLSILHRPPENLDEGIVEVPDPKTLEARMAETIDWWRKWSDQGRLLERYGPQARRSAIILKGLTHAPTGAMAAAPTTSLPESLRGGRNWDYRFSWVRDSAFAVRSLAELGHSREAEGFRRFIERSAAGSVEQLQILYGIGGERRLQELAVDELEGYRGIGPVRIGNAAETQIQMDVFGELLDLAWRWHLRGHTPDDDYWEFIVQLINRVARTWHQTDRGIWEYRDGSRHFVHSKVMCWATLDRGLKLAEDLGRDGPLAEWQEARSQVRRWVESEGYDARRGVFIQASGYPQMDAALLLIPQVGFVPYDDERMVRTTRAVREELEENGLLRRYAAESDGLAGREGVFLACSFWLAECLARQGNLNEARAVFERVLSVGNDLGLFAEEADPDTNELMGNFPQGLTHLSLISAAVAFNDMNGTKGK